MSDLRVVPLFPVNARDPVLQLRALADEIEARDDRATRDVVVVMDPGKLEVRHFGPATTAHAMMMLQCAIVHMASIYLAMDPGDV